MTEKNWCVEVKEWSGRYLSGDDWRICHPNEEEAGCMKFEEDSGKRAPHLQMPLGGTRLVCSRFKELKEGHCIWGTVSKEGERQKGE